jgi:hypothetical protein
MNIVLKLPLAFNARVEGLATLPVAVTMALEKATGVFRQGHGVVARAGDPRRLDKPLLAEVAKIARTRISRTIVVASEITTRDHSKRADGRQGPRFRAA